MYLSSFAFCYKQTGGNCKINFSQNKQAKRGNKGPGSLFECHSWVMFHGLKHRPGKSHPVREVGAYKGLGGGGVGKLS